MRVRFVIALMASSNVHPECGSDVLCWLPIHDSPHYRTLARCETDAEILRALDPKKFKCIEVQR